MRNLIRGGLLALSVAVWSGAPAVAQDGAKGGTPAGPQGAAVAEEMQAKAVVESVDHATRTILLRGEDGDLLSMKAGPEVRNFAQVKPGDRVVARVRLGVMAEMTPPGASGAAVQQADVAGRATPGSKPGGFAGEAMRVRVTFNSYDPQTKTVAFTLPTGEQKMKALQAPSMQDFAAHLKPGDKVDVTFVRSIAVAVLPAK